ncbi:MAG: hypothetical protein P8Z41_04810 [Anaerolineales bacterium]
MHLEHGDRRRWVEQISNINRRMNVNEVTRAITKKIENKPLRFTGNGRIRQSSTQTSSIQSGAGILPINLVPLSRNAWSMVACGLDICTTIQHVAHTIHPPSIAGNPEITLGTDAFPMHNNSAAQGCESDGHPSRAHRNSNGIRYAHKRWLRTASSQR